MSQRRDSANLNGLEACLQALLSLGTCGGAVAHSGSQWLTVAPREPASLEPLCH